MIFKTDASKNDWLVLVLESFYAYPLLIVIAASLILVWLDFDWHASVFAADLGAAPIAKPPHS